MKKGISLLFSVCALSGAVQAHAGDHGDFSLLNALGHMLNDPLHASLLLGAACTVAIGRALKLRRQR